MFATILVIGRPIKLYIMILHPNFTSPLVWDVIVLNLYAGLSLLYLYFLLLPDLMGSFKRLAIKVDKPKEFSEK